MFFHTYTDLDGTLHGSWASDATIRVCNGVVGDLMSVSQCTRGHNRKVIETKFYSLQWSTAIAFRDNAPDYDNTEIQMVGEFLKKL